MRPDFIVPPLTVMRYTSAPPQSENRQRGLSGHLMPSSMERARSSVSVPSVRETREPLDVGSLCITSHLYSYNRDKMWVCQADNSRLSSVRTDSRAPRIQQA